MLTTFRPSTHGFHFTNSFTDVSIQINLPGIDLPIIGRVGGNSINFSAGGRCAGMSWAAMDYFFGRRLIPTHTGADLPGGVPNLQTGLGAYIQRRHNEWNYAGDATELGHLAQIVFRPDTDQNINFANVNLYHCDSAFHYAKDLLGQIRSEIDAGRPVGLGLVAPTPTGQLTGRNHANVVWGYDGDTLKVYDCNYPDRDDVEVRPNENDHIFETVVGGNVKTTWRGIHPKTNYSAVAPSYQDLAFKSGVVLKNASGTVVNQINRGQTVRAEYTIRNQGEYPARLKFYYLAVRKVAGDHLDSSVNEDARLGVVDTDSDNTNDITLAPGTDFVVAKQSSTFDIVSWYRISGSFRSKQNCWLEYSNPASLANAAWISVQDYSVTWLTGTRGPQGVLHLFGRGSDGRIMYQAQGSNGVWGAPVSLSGYLPDGCLTAGTFPDGRVIVVHRGTTTHAYYRILQNNTWDAGWVDLVGSLTACPFLVLNGTKLRVCAMVQGGTVQFREEQNPGSWTNWANLI